MNRFLFIVLCMFLWPITASAQCAMPNGSNAEMGVIIFNKTHKVMQYCNGDDWIGLWGGGSGGGGVPMGAIMPFDLANCPSGWSEYTVARGRFLRGIDNGAGNDPDGTRVAGNLQQDAFQGHRHNLANQLGNLVSGWNLSGGGGQFYTGLVTYTTTDPITDGANGTPRIASETRPKNVAVLYCRKD